MSDVTFTGPPGFGRPHTEPATTPEPSSLSAEDTALESACELMHDAYEHAAALAGWSTQEASRKPWADVPPENKFAMRAAVRALLADERRRAGEREAALRERVEALASEWRYKGEFGWGPWQAGEGPDLEGDVLDQCATRLRAALAADEPEAAEGGEGA